MSKVKSYRLIVNGVILNNMTNYIINKVFDCNTKVRQDIDFAFIELNKGNGLYRGIALTGPFGNQIQLDLN